MSPHTGRRLLALRIIQRIILAPTAIGLAVYYLASRFSLPHKPLLVTCGVVVGWPIKLSLAARYEGWRRTRRARALGAVTANESRGKLFGGMDVLQELQKADKSGFIGEFVRFVRNPRITRRTQLFGRGMVHGSTREGWIRNVCYGARRRVPRVNLRSGEREGDTRHRVQQL